MKIAIIGYGKMGKAIENIALQRNYEIVLRISRQNLDKLTSENLQKADVAIEFSRPEVAYKNIETCIKAGIPVISGTTGWLNRKAEIEQLTKDKGGAFLYASNFSVGVNIFFAINRQLAEMMDVQEDYSVKIHEIHHTQKLDAPSGTAISLGQGILENIQRLKKWQALETDRVASQDILPITSSRIDSTPGTHVISYTSDIDEIEIKHTARSRQGFALGALMAAEWIRGKQGNFTMSDMLGF